VVEAQRPGDHGGVPTARPDDIAAAASALRDEGWVRIEQVVPRSSLDELRAAFAPQGATSTEHVEIDAATPNGDVWRGLADLAPIRALAAELLGDEVQVLVHGRNPGAGGGQQGLHADRPDGRRGGVEALTAIWMLDDFTAENGATRVVPGTHHAGRAVPRPLAQPDRRHPDEVVVTGRAGDVLVFDGHLWHSARRNTTTGPRRSAQMVLAGPTARLATPS
jgi:hypothetical protein